MLFSKRRSKQKHLKCMNEILQLSCNCRFETRPRGLLFFLIKNLNFIHTDLCPEPFLLMNIDMTILPIILFPNNRKKKTHARYMQATHLHKYFKSPKVNIGRITILSDFYRLIHDQTTKKHSIKVHVKNPTVVRSKV